MNTTLFQHIQDLLKSPCEAEFLRWTDICDDVHVRDADGNTALHWAARIGHGAGVSCLVNLGIDVNATNNAGATPLLVAAERCPNIGAIGCLLMWYGASLSGVDHAGRSVATLLKERHCNDLYLLLLSLAHLMEASGSLFLYHPTGTTSPPAPIPLPHSVLRPAETAAPQTYATDSSVQTLHSRPIPQPPSLPSLSSPANRNPSVDTVVSQAAMTLLEQQNFLKEEHVHRVTIEKEESEARLQCYCYSLPSSLTASSSMQRSTETVSSRTASPVILAVLGERHNSDGARYLLVRMRVMPPLLSSSQHYSPSQDVIVEEWLPYDDIAEDPVVAHYVRHLDLTGTIVGTARVEESFRSPSGHGSPLETWERDELEEQLQQIPRRMNSMPDAVRNPVVDVLHPHASPFAFEGATMLNVNGFALPTEDLGETDSVGVPRLNSQNYPRRPTEKPVMQYLVSRGSYAEENECDDEAPVVTIHPPLNSGQRTQLLNVVDSQITLRERRGSNLPKSSMQSHEQSETADTHCISSSDADLKSSEVGADRCPSLYQYPKPLASQSETPEKSNAVLSEREKRAYNDFLQRSALRLLAARGLRR